MNKKLLKLYTPCKKSIRTLFVDLSSHIDDEWWGKVYKCPYCGSYVIWRDFKFCPICGNKTHFHKVKEVN